MAIPSVIQKDNSLSKGADKIFHLYSHEITADDRWKTADGRAMNFFFLKIGISPIRPKNR
jgi:hypothetical protein